MANNTAIYCRVSTQMQSTDRQKDELLAFASQQNYTISNENIYIDVISGYSAGESRPQYSTLMKNVNQGKIRTILFSELTRLGRNSTELLAEIQRLQELNVQLYFQKQDLWIKDKQDLGSRILLAVLAVTTSYEIELLAERSLSGKINKIHSGGGVGGDNNAYGYRNNENKKMVIRENEAEIIRRIFTMYANGKSTIEICDILNAEQIPTAYKTRTKEFADNRVQKGLSPKKYKSFNPDKLSWKPNSISKILGKRLYLGHRHVDFRKPNVDKSKKNEKPEIIYTYDFQDENLRIISDELFEQVQERLSKAHYNKNNAIKHDNLLKHKLICGECGSNFSVGKSTETAKNYESGGRTYKCYGRINRKDKPRTCENGAEVRQWKLDGLVLYLSLKMFAEINFADTNKDKISTLEKDVTEYQQIRVSKEEELNTLTKNYKNAMQRLAYASKDDSVVNELINEEKERFTFAKNELQTTIDKYHNAIIVCNATIQKLKHLSVQYINLKDRMHEIWNSKELVRNMIDEYVEKVLIYKIHKFWNLIVVKYTNGVEFWGTIKSARYKKNEMFYDETLCRYGLEFHTWVINNSDNSFVYNQADKTIKYNGKSDLYTEFKAGVYTFNEMHKLIRDTNWLGSYPFYKFENNTSENTSNKVTKNDINVESLREHNDKFFKRLKKTRTS